MLSEFSQKMRLLHVAIRISTAYSANTFVGIFSALPFDLRENVATFFTTSQRETCLIEHVRKILPSIDSRLILSLKIKWAFNTVPETVNHAIKYNEPEILAITRELPICHPYRGSGFGSFIRKLRELCEEHLTSPHLWEYLPPLFRKSHRSNLVSGPDYTVKFTADMLSYSATITGLNHLRAIHKRATLTDDAMMMRVTDVDEIENFLHFVDLRTGQSIAWKGMFDMNTQWLPSMRCMMACTYVIIGSGYHRVDVKSRLRCIPGEQAVSITTAANEVVINTQGKFIAGLTAGASIVVFPSNPSRTKVPGIICSRSTSAGCQARLIERFRSKATSCAPVACSFFMNARKRLLCKIFTLLLAAEDDKALVYIHEFLQSRVGAWSDVDLMIAETI